MADFRMRLYPSLRLIPLPRALARVYQWPVEGILVGNGSDEILSILFRATLGQGRPCPISGPDLQPLSYPGPNAGSPDQRGETGSNFDLDFKRFSPNARLTLWGYPNPPVGNCFDQTRMKFFLQKAKGLVLIDEAYVDFSNQNCLNLARQYPKP